eukprot:COSAG05_NODE_183_length_14758_cov_90.142506_12_plen_101_part_00
MQSKSSAGQMILIPCTHTGAQNIPNVLLRDSASRVEISTLAQPLKYTYGFWRALHESVHFVHDPANPEDFLTGPEGNPCVQLHAYGLEQLVHRLYHTGHK